jgi:hypothetical protein
VKGRACPIWQSGAHRNVRTRPYLRSAISFGRHHRLRARGVETREGGVGLPDLDALGHTQSPTVESAAHSYSRSRSWGMGFFHDKSGNPAYVLAEKVRDDRVFV